MRAQSQAPAAPQAPAPFNPGDGMAFAKMMQSDMELLMELGMELTGAVVKDLPFSAQLSIETEQVLADGTHILRKEEGSLCRDRLGRLRQELKLPLPPPMASAEIGTIAILSDPSTGAHWTLMPAAKTAMKMTMPTGSAGKINVDSNAEKNFRGFSGFGDDGSAEKLGAQNMEGVSATGTRFTHTIPAGQLGNDQPLQLVTERWYSSEIHMTVFLKRSDPMNGSKTLKVMDIRREEPDAARFNVPSDYAVHEMILPAMPSEKPSQP
jgi:hypothetical protein